MLLRVLKALLLALAGLGMALGPAPAHRQAVLVSGPYEYSLQEGQGAVISRYLGQDRVLQLPEELEGHPVIGIGPRAFSGLEATSNLVVPEGVLFIGEEAFGSSPGLKYLSLPASLARIGDDAFLGRNDKLVLTVQENSYAHRYAVEEGIIFLFPDCFG